MRDVKSIGIWNPSIATDPTKFGQINITATEIAKDQLIQLYIMLYPFIATEFAHRSDLQNWASTMRDQFRSNIDETNIKLDLLTQEAKNHFHTGQGAVPSATAKALKTPSISLWKALPEDKDFREGEQFIVDNSSYTKAITHRNPSVDAKHSKTKLFISKLFAVILKFTPYDVNKNNINTGDDDFVNR